MSVTINGTNGLTFNDNSTQTTAATGFGFKNRIINGAMVIDQRNAGASVAGSGYAVDRFYDAFTSTNATQQRSTTAPQGFTNSLLVTVTTATAPGTTSLHYISQTIEGFNVADMDFGKATAITFTLSFWVRSSLTGTYAIGFLNGAQNRSYVATYTINSANTWEYKTVTVAGDTSGTWLADNGKGLCIFWDLGSGSNYQATAGSWQSGLFLRTSGSANFANTLGATFYITGVQLEKGSTATSFDVRPYGTELQLCQRYYVKTFPQATAPAQNAGNTGALEVVGQATNTLITVNWMLPVEMRDTPSTVTTYSTNAASANWSTNTQTPTASLGSTGSKLIAVRAGTSLAAGSAYFINVTASAEL